MLEKLCLETEKIVKVVGQFIENELGQVDDSKIEVKGRNDFVSYVDKTAERMLVKELSELLPTATFVTEEGTIKNERSEYFWVIDPLDGTTNFLHQIPHFSISVALVKENIPIIGVVFEVNLKESFYAWKGGGAYLNGKKIRVSDTLELKEALIATGFPYEKNMEFDKFIKMFGQIIKHTRGIRRMGSAALDLAYVAAGRFDGYFETYLNPWDVAGGICLVQEAGGIVQDFSGGNDFLFGDSILAATPSIAKDFQQITSKLYE